MPAYPGNDLATLMYENEQKFFWFAEIVPVGTMSVAYQLRRERGAFYPNGFSVQVSFSATPGVFEVDVMGSDVDQADQYVLLGTINAVTGTFVARAEFPTAWVKYVALLNKTAPNAATVSMTAMVTR